MPTNSRKKEKNEIVESTKRAETLFEERNKNNIEVTERNFRTAYECAQSQLSFREYPRLINLQNKNGLNCGNILYSDHACADILQHIASQMKKEIVDYIIKTKNTFSLMADESTSCSNEQSLIVNIRTLFEGEPCVYFLGLLPLSGTTSETIYNTLIDFLTNIGLTDEILANQFVAFCSDGASNMLGKHQGVATLLQSKYPNLVVFHCMAHRLELAVKQAIDDVNSVSHFRDLIDSIYKLFSMSPKNQRELNDAAAETAVQLLKVKKIFDVRWVFSSYVAMKAFLRNFEALHTMLVKAADDNTRTAKERSKYLGLSKKMQNWFVVAEACLIKDTLRVLKQLSMFFQADSSSITSALPRVANAKEKLLALKTSAGKSEQKLLDSYESQMAYKGVHLSKNDTDEQRFSSLKRQLCQALADNLDQRFPCTELLGLSQVLDHSTWPNDLMQRAVYGDTAVMTLCKKLNISSVVTAEVIYDFSRFKKGCTAGSHLKQVFDLLSIFPISSAACERGFSQMNLQQTDGRNKLAVQTVSSLLMISVNGPPIDHWNPRKYVISWLKSGHHGALDKPSGPAKQQQKVTCASKLFVSDKS